MAKSLGQDTSKFEATKVEIKQFYANEALKVDQRVAKQAQEAAAAAAKQAQDAAKAQAAEYEKRVQEGLKKTKEAEQKKINLTQEGTQERVNAEIAALQAEQDYLKKYQKTLKLSNDQLFNINAEYTRKKEKLQDDYDKKVQGINNREVLAQAEANVLKAQNELEKFNADIKLLEAKAAIELENDQLTATEKENIELKLAEDIKAINKGKNDFLVAEANKLLEADKLRAETALSKEQFDQARAKMTVDQQKSAADKMFQLQTEALDKQKAAELANTELTAEQKEAIEEKYRQAKIVAEEEKAKKLNEIEAKQIQDGLNYATMGVQATQQLTDLFFSFKKRKYKEGTKEAEKAARQEFAVQKAFNLGDRKSTRLNSSHIPLSRMPSSA